MGDVIKIAHIVTIYRGAVGILEAKLVALDSYEDIEITVITPPPPKNLNLPPSAVRQISTYMVRPIRPLSDLWSLWKMYKLLKCEKFNIVHTHSAKAGMIGSLAAWLAKTTFILHTYHGLPFYDGQNKIAYNIYRLLEKFACKFRHFVFSQNRRDMTKCVKLMGNSKKVFYEGTGVYIEWVKQKATENIQQAEKDFPQGKFRILIVSRLEPVKRIEDFVEMCGLLKKNNLDFCAVIAGYGPLEDDLRQRIYSLNLSEKVKMLGWASHAVSLMACSDVVVLTSEKEGIPRSLIEAMSLGKPVVATDVLGTQELVVNNVTGYLTPFKNPSAMAEKILLLANDSNLAKRFSEAAKQRVLHHFNDLKIAEFLRNFYITKCNGEKNNSTKK